MHSMTELTVGILHDMIKIVAVIATLNLCLAFAQRNKEIHKNKPKLFAGRIKPPGWKFNRHRTRHKPKHLAPKINKKLITGRIEPPAWLPEWVPQIHKTKAKHLVPRKNRKLATGRIEPPAWCFLRRPQQDIPKLKRVTTRQLVSEKANPPPWKSERVHNTFALCTPSRLFELLLYFYTINTVCPSKNVCTGSDLESTPTQMARFLINEYGSPVVGCYSAYLLWFSAVPTEGIYVVVTSVVLLVDYIISRSLRVPPQGVGGFKGFIFSEIPIAILSLVSLTGCFFGCPDDTTNEMKRIIRSIH